MCSNDFFCTTDPTLIVLGLNPCFRSERQETDLLSNGKALIIFEGYKQKTVKDLPASGYAYMYFVEMPVSVFEQHCLISCHTLLNT
jgi:hypothetical protein